MNLKIYLALILSIAVSRVTSNVIANEGSKDAKVVDQDRVDRWVRLFYDKCGETEVVDVEKLPFPCLDEAGIGPGVGIGKYCSGEVVKRCVGDREGCIEEKNCYFAIAITETATFMIPPTTTTTSTAPPPTTPTPSSTTPVLPTYDDYLRTVTGYSVKVLDACHLKPLANDETVPQKFVGVGLGVFNSTEATGALDCDKDPSFENFRAYFFLNDFQACDINPDVPVYPYMDTIYGDTSPNNEFTVDIDTWKKTTCPSIKSHMPPSATPATRNSDFMKYLLLHYYGTQEYTKYNNFNYSDTPNFFQSKGNIMFLAPEASKRTESGGSIFSASICISVAVFFNVIKSITCLNV